MIERKAVQTFDVSLPRTNAKQIVLVLSCKHALVRAPSQARAKAYQCHICTREQEAHVPAVAKSTSNAELLAMVAKLAAQVKALTKGKPKAKKSKQVRDHHPSAYRSKVTHLAGESKRGTVCGKGSVTAKVTDAPNDVTCGNCMHFATDPSRRNGVEAAA